jgi:hypothetical protein
MRVGRGWCRAHPRKCGAAWGCGAGQVMVCMLCTSLSRRLQGVCWKCKRACCLCGQDRSGVWVSVDGWGLTVGSLPAVAQRSAIKGRGWALHMENGCSLGVSRQGKYWLTLHSGTSIVAVCTHMWVLPLRSLSPLPEEHSSTVGVPMGAAASVVGAGHLHALWVQPC